jgi:hypothetical protein
MFENLTPAMEASRSGNRFVAHFLERFNHLTKKPNTSLIPEFFSIHSP